MVQLMGIFIFLGFFKKIKKLFKDKKTTIAILIAAIVLSNLPFFDLLHNSDLANFIEGLINGAMIMAGFTLLTGKYYQEDVSSQNTSANPTHSQDKKYTQQLVIPPVNQNYNQYSSSSNSLLPSNNDEIRKTALAAVTKYLQNRNYRVFKDNNNEFDLIALDSRNTEHKITVVAFEYKNNDSLISFDKNKLENMIKMDRSHRLFIVTDCYEDDDAKYLGNYVTIYYLDSPISETGFTLKGNIYTNTLRKLKKYSYDQEISVKTENLI